MKEEKAIRDNTTQHTPRVPPSPDYTELTFNKPNSLLKNGTVLTNTEGIVSGRDERGELESVSYEEVKGITNSKGIIKPKKSV